MLNKLTIRQRILLNYIYLDSEYPYNCFTKEQLKKELGCSEPTLRKELKILEDSCLIEIIKTSFQLIKPKKDINLRNKIIGLNIKKRVV